MGGEGHTIREFDGIAPAGALLVDAGAGDLAPGIDDALVAGADRLAEQLSLYRYLTRFTASNTGTGTNHVAVYGCAVYRVGVLLEREDYVDLAQDVWRRLVADQRSPPGEPPWCSGETLALMCEDHALQLELREGDRVNGRELGAEALELAGDDLGGEIDAGKFRVRFPRKGARFVWPHDPYNPYDVKNKKSPPDKYVSLLHLPVGPEGVQVLFQVRG